MKPTLIAETGGVRPPSGPPAEIRLRVKNRTLDLHWPDRSMASIPFSRLRAACACAGCTARKRAGAAPDDVSGIELSGVEPVGSVGLQLVFSDGHDRGIYPWSYLQALSEVQT